MILPLVFGLIFLPVHANEEIAIPSGNYAGFYKDEPLFIHVNSFSMNRYPITNASYMEFVKANPDWRRSRIKRIFADKQYLRHWKSDLLSSDPQSPVVNVSWFAAEAYCEWRHKSLPTVDQWEYVANEGGKNSDAVNELLFDWYSHPNLSPVPSVKTGYKNAYGIVGLIGLVWEWTLDFNSSLVTSEGRGEDSGRDTLFCGASSSNARNPTDYVKSMRYAFRNSLKASYTTGNLGFRCVRNQ